MVQTQGCLPFRLQECDLEQQASLTVLVEQLKEGGRPLVCIDMGSIPRMGLLPDPAHFMRALSQGLKAAGCCGLMLTGGHIPWGALCRNYVLSLYTYRRDSEN